MKRVSIKDVAKAAGVSTSTISYVLNNKASETISPATQQRVREAVERLGYVPNQSARSLISRRSNLIGVIIPQTEPGKEFMFSNPFYGEFLSSVEYTARQNGYHLLISGTEANAGYLRIARNRGVDGVILVGTYPSGFIEELKQLGVPVALVDAYIKDPYFHTIGIDDRKGGYIATRYLLEKGHREIAFVSGVIKEHGVNDKRYQGYLDALREAGIEPDARRVYAGEVDYAYGIRAAQEMAARGLRETAAFCTADILAVGLVKGIRAQGRAVPEDVSVVGFDDVYLSEICDPSLTTVRQDIRLKGERAVQLLIHAQEREERETILLPIEIVERDSVRALCEREQGRGR